MCNKVCKSDGGLKNHIAPKHKPMEEETSDMDISDNSDGEICEVNKCGNGSKEITIMVLKHSCCKMFVKKYKITNYILIFTPNFKNSNLKKNQYCPRPI